MVKCSICGKDGLSIVGVCPDCLKRAAVDGEQIQRLSQLSDVLNITADTDRNIKGCVQSLAEMLRNLERRSYVKEEKSEKESNAI